VLFSGIVFGLYHLRLTQAIPLSLLGIYLAYVTWRSGSLVPAVLLHLLNNAMAVVAGSVAQADAATGEPDLTSIEVPFYILVPAVLVFAGILVALQRRGAATSDGGRIRSMP